MQVTKNRVVFLRKNWEDIKKNEDYKELVDIIEDSEKLQDAKAQTEYFIDLEDYILKRKSRENVQDTTIQ